MLAVCLRLSKFVCFCVCVCVHACVRACMSVCVCLCVGVHVWMGGGVQRGGGGEENQRSYLYQHEDTIQVSKHELMKIHHWFQYKKYVKKDKTPGMRRARERRNITDLAYSSPNISEHQKTGQTDTGIKENLGSLHSLWDHHQTKLENCPQSALY